MRLIKTLDLKGNLLVILTNNFDKKAEEIADIYRLRWKIELFFKWIKQHCRIKVFYGKSANAVENQIFIALITYCLLILAKLKEGYNGSLLTFVRILKACIFNPFGDFLAELRKRPSKTSKGRRKNNYIQEFDRICEYFEKIELENDIH
nr:transposase [Fusibacter sp. 3D3]